ncbi:MAG TPA: LysE family transporter [Actinoplanes sp.]|nr:LysE family transporter [Actinoplanes sp.]
MSASFVAGAVAGYGIAVPVGAIAALIVSLTARTSLRVGAAAGLGAATADGVYALVAVLGGTALAGAIAPIATPLRWVAAAVLLALATHTTVAAVRHHRDRARPRSTAGLATPGRAYLGLLALTLLNPSTVVYFAALVLGGGAADGGGAMFVLGAALASASWQLLLAGGGSIIGRLLTGHGGRLITALVSSAVIAALAVAVLLG